jgi:Flp pilus assembly protein TadB
VVFYTILFSAMAVLLVVAGVMYTSRSRNQMNAERQREHAGAEGQRRQRNAKRAQSRHDRRKRR